MVEAPTDAMDEVAEVNGVVALTSTEEEVRSDDDGTADDDVGDELATTVPFLLLLLKANEVTALLLVATVLSLDSVAEVIGAECVWVARYVVPFAVSGQRLVKVV